MRTFCLFALLLLSPLWVGHTVLFVPPAAVLHGIDVSHYQQRIDWEKVLTQQPLEFAFVKATEGHSYTDSLFCRNWDALARHGVRRGAYHFFRAYGCGDEQARHFLETVDMQPGDLAPVLDIESTDGIPPEIMLEEARIWLQTVETELRVKPIIYTNQHFYEQHLAGWFDNYPLWVARYSPDKPSLPAGRNWNFWQYSNAGCLAGIEHKTDLNVFAGTEAMLEKLCWFPQPPGGIQPAEATMAP